MQGRSSRLIYNQLIHATALGSKSDTATNQADTLRTETNHLSSKQSPHRRSKVTRSPLRTLTTIGYKYGTSNSNPWGEVSLQQIWICVHQHPLAYILEFGLGVKMVSGTRAATCSWLGSLSDQLCAPKSTKHDPHPKGESHANSAKGRSAYRQDPRSKTAPRKCTPN